MTDILLSQIQFSIKWLNFIMPIISSSQQEYDYGYSIIKKYVIDRKYETQTDFDFLKSIPRIFQKNEIKSKFFLNGIFD